MAIQILYSTDNEDYLTAYARIDEINTNYVNRRAHIVVQYYKTKAAANNGKRPVGYIAFDLAGVLFDQFLGLALYAASKTDPKKLGYIYLMTLPEFSNGIEV